MKLIYAINDPEFFLSHRASLADNAIKSGYQVFLLSDFTHLDTSLWVDKGIQPIQVEVNRSSKSILSNLRLILSLIKIYKKYQPNIIHQITLKFYLFGTLSTFFFNNKIKIVNAVTGLGYLYTKDRISLTKMVINSLLRLIIKKKYAHFIFQNEVDLELFKKMGLLENHTLIKGSGVDHNGYQLIPEPENKKITILFTGRILKDKGVLDLIQAVKRLSPEIKKQVVLKLYGKIDPENPAHINEELLKSQLIEGLIEWKGFSKEIKTAIAESHIYCLPSYREGLPKSTIEAMAIGRPVVTTNAAGCDDTVIEEYNGFKVPPGNIEMLAKQLGLLIHDKQLRIKMGKNSRKLFEKEFTLDKVVNQTFELYDKVLKI
jgi:glycosyltransferase involved in cell wall biosynthesis